MAEWYALHTKPRHEKKVAEELVSKSMEVYLPMERKLKVWSDRKKWVEEPLIKSYLFVYCSVQDLERVRYTQGIVKPVLFNGKATPVRQVEIDNLKIIIGSGIPYEETAELFTPGDRVRIEAGKFAGVEGVLVETHGRYRLLVNVEVVNFTLKVEVSTSLVRTIKKFTKVHGLPENQVEMAF